MSDPLALSGPPPPPLSRAFFARPAEVVAPDLLGAVLVRRRGDRWQAARLVETEAYVGPHDLACHASRGRTARTAVMFGPAGHAYVYLIYGMWELLNVVTGPEGHAEAVLLRAAEPLSGPLRPPRGPASLSGPGRLSRALGITRALDGHDLCAPADGERPPLYLAAGPPPASVAITRRVGVEGAGDWAGAPLRFLDAGSPSVSPLR